VGHTNRQYGRLTTAERATKAAAVIEMPMGVEAGMKAWKSSISSLSATLTKNQPLVKWWGKKWGRNKENVLFGGVFLFLSGAFPNDPDP